MSARRRVNESEKPRRRPATTPEGRETEVVSLAIDLAEQQIRDGTASSQVITHFLKLGSSREQLEQARLASDVELANEKIQQIRSAARTEELYAEAMAAMKSYSPSNHGQD